MPKEKETIPQLLKKLDKKMRFKAFPNVSIMKTGIVIKGLFLLGSGYYYYSTQSNSPPSSNIPANNAK
jgi:hypothetical protein